jgi:2-hydroxychromene-2-carboxylate isomerase
MPYRVPLWIDLRSRASRAAHHFARDLEREFDVTIDRRPYAPGSRVSGLVVGAAAFLFAKQHRMLAAWLDVVYARVLDHALDIDDASGMAALLGEMGLAPAEFRRYCETRAEGELAALQAQAATLGISDVPTFVLDGELFLGQAQVDQLRLRLAARGFAYGVANPALADGSAP